MTVGLAGLASAFLVAGLALYLLLTASVTRSVDAAARTAAVQVAALAEAGRLPDPVPTAGAQLVQVLDDQGRVVAASLTADRLTPLVDAADQAKLAAGQAVTVPGRRAALSGNLRAVAVGARAPSGATRLLVVAALPTADLESGSSALRRLLLVFFPLVLAAAAVVAWRMIGAALRSVDDLRREAERIGAQRRPTAVGTGPSATTASPAGPHAPAARADGERLTVPDSHDEVAALAVTLNGMLDRLAASRAQQRAFVADAAHELRSPLASIRTQLEVADRLGDGGSLPAALLGEVERLSAVVEDLLTLARAGDGAPPAAQDVAVRPVLDAVADRRSGDRVPVSLGACEEGLVARAAPGDLERVLTNLIDNAVRHAGTQVHVAGVRAPSGQVAITVTDDGHGVPAAERERVFDRFARLDEARARDSGGSGLGLAIARELVRRNGGELTLEDAAPGLRAVITLPSAPSPPRTA